MPEKDRNYIIVPTRAPEPFMTCVITDRGLIGWNLLNAHNCMVVLEWIPDAKSNFTHWVHLYKPNQLNYYSRFGVTYPYDVDSHLSAILIDWSVQILVDAYRDFIYQTYFNIK